MAAKKYRVAVESAFTPITALSFFNQDTIIAGEGSYLKVFCSKTTRSLKVHKVFKNSRIHRLKVILTCDTRNSSIYAVLGGKTIRLVEISRKDDEILISCVNEEKTFHSWIWDAVLLEGENTDQEHKNKLIAIVSSQNVVVIWNWKKDSILNVSWCEDQCILYSAAFWGQNIATLIAAVGTVFNEVLLWKPFRDDCLLSAETKSNEAVLKRLTGHEGVIFKVVFKDNGQQLLSVSDDRSIRLWDLNSSSCLRVLYGHKARVWSAMFFNDRLVSIGEDATCILWDVDGSIIKKYKGHRGKSIWSLAIHEPSKSIVTGGGDGGIRLWSTSSFTYNQSCGAVDVLLPESIEHDKIESTYCRDAKKEEDFPRTIRLLSSSETLALTNNGCFLLYTSDLSNGAAGEWKVIFQDANYSSYCCLDVSNDIRLTVLGNLHGMIKVVLIDSGISTEFAAFEGKVFSIFISKYSKNHTASSNTIERCLIASGPDGKLLLWNISICDEDITVTAMGSFKLPYCRQRWAAAIALLDSNLLQGNSCIKFGVIVGDRRGSLHVFHGTDKEENLKDPSQSLLSVHGKTGITSVVTVDDYVCTTGRDGFYRKFRLNENLGLEPLDAKKVCKGMDWIEGLIITGEDTLLYGFYMQSYFAVWSSVLNEMILKIQCGGGYRSWDLHIPSLNTDPSAFAYLKGPVMKSCVLPIISNQRVIKEGLHGRELNCINILGKLRIKDDVRILFASGSEDTLVHFVTYSKERKQFDCIHTLEGHIGSVKSIAFLVERMVSASTRLTTDRKNPTEEIHCNIPYLMFTCGSRTSLKCTRVIFQTDGKVNSSLLAEIGTPINSMKSKAKMLDMTDSDDLRFLSLQVFPAVTEVECREADRYCVAAACSDGVVRLYGFSSSKKSFVSLKSSNYHSRCVQTVRYFCFTNGTTIHHIVLSGATDGRIALWDLTETIQQWNEINLYEDEIQREYELRVQTDKSDLVDSGIDESNILKPRTITTEGSQLRYSSYFLTSRLHSSAVLEDLILNPLHVFQAHQSGIHCIDVIQVSDNSFILASGGDDNALFSSNFQVHPSTSSGEIVFNEIWNSKSIFAHHSTITGVRLLAEDILMTCSVDQRLKIWKRDKNEISSTDSRWEISFTSFTDIADVSDLSGWMESETINAVIGGVGVEIKEISCN